MKTNFFLEEAIDLCEAILETTSPTQKWGIVNLVKSVKKDNEDRTFNSLKFQQIPMSYYFAYDDIPFFLLHQGVFSDIENGSAWFIEVGEYSDFFEMPTENIFEKLTETATKKGWINDHLSKSQLKKLWKNEQITVFFNSNIQKIIPDEYERQYVNWVSEGPDKLHHVVLFDKDKMEQFVNIHKNLIPAFDEKSGVMTFLGEEVKFVGEQANLMKLLITNINSIVTFKEIYETIGANYDKDLKSMGGKKAKIHNPILDRFKEIKKKIKASPLKRYLVLGQSNGLGIFIDQRKIQDISP